MRAWKVPTVRAERRARPAPEETLEGRAVEGCERGRSPPFVLSEAPVPRQRKHSKGAQSKDASVEGPHRSCGATRPPRARGNTRRARSRRMRAWKVPTVRPERSARPAPEETLEGRAVEGCERGRSPPFVRSDAPAPRQRKHSKGAQSKDASVEGPHRSS